MMDRIYIVDPEMREKCEPKQKWEYHEWRMDDRHENMDTMPPDRPVCV